MYDVRFGFDLLLMLGDLPFVLLLVMAVIVDEFDAITASYN